MAAHPDSIAADTGLMRAPVPDSSGKGPRWWSDMTEEEQHDYHHALIEERVALYRDHPKRTGVDRIRRQRAGQRAVVTLDGHLRQFHGRRKITGPPQGLNQLEALHRQAHEV